MRSRIGKLLTLLLAISYVHTLVLPPASFADDTIPFDYNVKYLPKGRMCQENFRCFTLIETKQLVILDLEHHALTLDNEELKKIQDELDHKILLLNKQIELNYDNYITMLSDRDRLSKKWEKSDEQLQNAEADKSWWRSMAFLGTGVGILVGIIGGFIINSAVSK